MTMLLTVSAGGVPVGGYTATFRGIDPVPADPTRGFGAAIRWQFEVATGPHAGGKTSRITTPTPSAKNACGKMLAGMTGKSLTPGEKVDLASFVGRNFLIVVAATDSGATRVETVAAPPV